MHDIDSTRLEASPDQNEFQESQDFESQNGQGEDTFEMPMTEGEEEALAAELLGVSSETEMDQFLGGLFRKIARGLGGAGKFLSQNAGPLSGALKGLAAKALPFLGGALGTVIPIPGVGTALGAALGRAASHLVQSELDNLEVEEQDLEMSKRYVRLASQAIRHSARVPRRANPYATANLVLRNALQRLRGRGGFRPRPRYRPDRRVRGGAVYQPQPIYGDYPQQPPCPQPEPCPACPMCAQPLPAGDPPPPAASGDSGAAPGAAAGAGAGTSSEFDPENTEEFVDTGELDGTGEIEGEGEGETYETDNQLLAASGASAVAAADGFVVAARSSSTDFDAPGIDSHRFLEFEAQALLTRLHRVKPFALQMTSVPAAAVSLQAQDAIERVLAQGRRELQKRVDQFLAWIKSATGRLATAADAQRRFSMLRLRFNAVLTQVDLFADALVQRSEHEYGTWLGGLDVVAADGLALPGYYEAPPVICYLDRGAGAAIRRARTRLPGGGGENPVALIRVPRERMIGSGIASSLVHEVGHQAASLLNLVNSLRPELQARHARGGSEQLAWQLWERWISEIVADFWAVARVGIASTTGLIAVVSLPRAFVFRVTLDDPHPFPWVRVKLSCAMGDALSPDPQWKRLSQLWDSFYPTAGLDEARRGLISKLQRTLRELVDLLVQHRPEALRGQSLPQVLAMQERTPQRLRTLWQAWRSEPSQMRSTKPTLAFAVIGQARADGTISPQEESRTLGELLTLWAVRDATGKNDDCQLKLQPREQNNF